MGTDDHRSAGRACEPDSDFSAAGLEPDAFRIEAHDDTFGFENLLNRSRYIVVLSRDQPWRPLHDGHRGTEAAVHLRKLKADIAAADHDQMAWQRVELENRRVGQCGNTIDSGQFRNERAAAYIDEDVLRGDPITAHLHLARRDKARVAMVNRATLHPLKPGFDAPSCSRRDHVLAPLHGLHVNCDFTP